MLIGKSSRPNSRFDMTLDAYGARNDKPAFDQERQKSEDISYTGLLNRPDLQTLYGTIQNARHGPYIKSRDLTVTHLSKCAKLDCRKKAKKRNLCSQHWQTSIKNQIRKVMKDVYRGPDYAYSSMDFSGVGQITESDFIKSQIAQRLPFPHEELIEFLKETQLFAHGMNFDYFKKVFFPHLYVIVDDDCSDEEKKEREDKNQMQKNRANQSNVIKERLTRLEKLLKTKFQNNWDSVRKSFLDLDSDYDGYITVEDILRYFGADIKQFHFNDLKKLILEKDSKKRGKLGYTDFSKWVGNCIHQSEGFYFRHDSIKNPVFDRNIEKQSKEDKPKEEVSRVLISANLETTIIDKIKQQWKTIRKAFIDLNKDKSGMIEPAELKFYLNHWGLSLNDQQFDLIWKKFDYDGDGMISYKDFHKTVGSEIHPGESLYFRQDKPHMMRITKCKHQKCWQPTQGQGTFCQLHQKMYKDQVVNQFQQMFNKIGKARWPQFIQRVKESSLISDRKQIEMKKFVDVLEEFNILLSGHQKEVISDTFPGKASEGDYLTITISQLHDVGYNNQLKRFYEQVNVDDMVDEDVAIDTMGYTGNFLRHLDKRVLKPISKGETLDIIYKNKKLLEVMKAIKDIDKENNGYVTSTELDDILKMYNSQLKERDLAKIISPFASIQNRVLIDYKAFRTFVIKGITQRTNDESAKKNEIIIRSEEKVPKSIVQNSRSSGELHKLTLGQINKTIDTNPDKLLVPRGVSAFATIRERPSRNYDNQQQQFVKTVKRPITPNLTSGFIKVGSTVKMGDEIQKQARSTAYLYNSTRSCTTDQPDSKFTYIYTIGMLKNAQNKLQYEWKNIYRQINNQDMASTGMITKKQFEDSVSQTGVTLTREEITKLFDTFGESKSRINYDKMSQSLGLHKKSFDLMKQTHMKINRLKSASRAGTRQGLRNIVNKSRLVQEMAYNTNQS